VGSRAAARARIERGDRRRARDLLDGLKRQAAHDGVTLSDDFKKTAEDFLFYAVCTGRQMERDRMNRKNR
jgi:hypothetical protein